MSTFSTLKRNLKNSRADLMMSGMVLVWGFHFIIVKDAVENIAPLTFNALRFLVGWPVIVGLAWYQQRALRLSRRDVALMVGLTLIGPVCYQVGFALGIKRTTSTNAALLLATMPTWTALFSILMRIVEARRRLLVGIAVTLGGVMLVVYSRAEEGFALSHDDLIGSALLLGAAITSGVANVINSRWSIAWVGCRWRSGNTA